MGKGERRWRDGDRQTDRQTGRDRLTDRTERERETGQGQEKQQTNRKASVADELTCALRNEKRQIKAPKSTDHGELLKRTGAVITRMSHAGLPEAETSPTAVKYQMLLPA